MDISNLSEKELRDLNHQVVLRLKFLQDAHANKAMMDFSYGEFVCFDYNDCQIVGHIEKFNKKTVTVIEQGGKRWNIPPQLLKSVKSPEVKDVTPQSKVLVSRSRSSTPPETRNKVSRNRPCPCGSGKKYKRCCGLYHKFRQDLQDLMVRRE